MVAGSPSSPDQEEALTRFCDAYYYPLYAFARRSGQNREQAEDLTQGFFLHLLKDGVLARVKREGSRFRSFLLTAFTNHCRNVWAGEKAIKRIPVRKLCPLDDTAEDRYSHEPIEHVTPEMLYDRHWALSVQEQVFKRLSSEDRAAGKERQFSCLMKLLPGARDEMSYAEASQTLGMTEEAVRMAVSRFRRRYGKALREEIATPGTPKEEVDEEIRYLIGILRGI